MATDKNVFKKKLREYEIPGIFAIMQIRIFCLPVQYLYMIDKVYSLEDSKYPKVFVTPNQGHRCHKGDRGNYKRKTGIKVNCIQGHCCDVTRDNNFNYTTFTSVHTAATMVPTVTLIHTAATRRERSPVGQSPCSSKRSGTRPQKARILGGNQICRAAG